MVMFEFLFVLVAIFIIYWRGRNKPDTGKYSRERQLKKYYETGNERYLYDRDYD